MRGEERSFVRLSGGLITTHFANLLQDEDHGFEYARPETFIHPWKEEDAPPQDETHFLKQVREVWESLLRRFDEKYLNIKSGKMNEEDVRRLWQRPLLDALGFDAKSSSKLIVISDKLKFHFSHRGWFPKNEIAKPPVIHILPPGTDPDKRPSPGKPSPHDALQDCLNRHDATWAILMNEMVIRILRDYHHTTVPGYIEFDLEGIFLNRSFPEFLALYRFCHASRFARNAETGKEPLEEYYEVSRQAGEKIGESLRGNVVTAIEELGNGFLDAALIEQVRGDREACQAYYQEILRVVYRIIFMLFAEQRGMLGVGGDQRDLFLEEYSITSLRERVDAFVERDDRNTDLWEGLSVTFGMLEKGVAELGVNAFDGLLFSRANEHYLKDARCRNTALMNAIRALTWTVPIAEGRGRRQRFHGRQRISYADLSVEEIGAIYESLLDYTPRITEGFEEIEKREYRPGEFMLDPRGSERKSTGSYYTNPDLIAELIKSALDPVIAYRLSQAGPDPTAREKELLSIRVCDPACGSGAFLIAAANRLGYELAKIREQTELPSAKEVQMARRDVLSHCIYGVDLNPMAVELAKVSLWINALVDDMPLSFLDHHIKCGNSLIGATPDLIASGIPDEAYTAVVGDNQEIASGIKRANREQRRHQTFAEFGERIGLADQCADLFAALVDCSENNPDAVNAKQQEYERLCASVEYERQKWTADCWCAAFFWPLKKGHVENIPTSETVRMVAAQGKEVLPVEVWDKIRLLAGRYQFFHWNLEFPEVFKNGGFDCVLGNPPWDKIKINSDEFFSRFDENFRKGTTSEKKKRIEEYCSIKTLSEDWISYCNKIEYFTKYYKNSNSFSFQGQGDLNAYKLFLERYFQVTTPKGYYGIIIPSGIDSDKGCTDLRKMLFSKNKVSELYCFENKKKIFPIHSSFKFVILTARKGLKSDNIRVAFNLHNFDALNNIEKYSLEIPVTLIQQFSPDTLSIMEFVDQKEVKLMSKLFNNNPNLSDWINNSWNVRFHRDLHITDDRDFFTREPTPIKIFEGKMIHHYNHRFGEPQFWITEKDVATFYSKRDYEEWLTYRLAYRAIARSTDKTTLICTILPKNVATALSLRVITIFQKDKDLGTLKKLIEIDEQLFVCSIMNSYILNFIIRRKVSANISEFYIQQLPIPRLKKGNFFFDQIIARAARLICTTEDFGDLWADVYSSDWKNFAEINGGISKITNWENLHAHWNEDCGITNGWDNQKHDIADRAQLRYEIDALVANLYGLEHSELEYILSTFPAVQEKTPWMIEGTLREFDRIKLFLQNMVVNITKKSHLDKPIFNSIINNGENERVEFKSSLSWDIQTKNKNKDLEHTIAKTIASLMNTHGGMLFVGVSDSGEILGLAGDIKISKRQNEDGLRLRFDDLVKNYLGNQFLPLIKINSLKTDGKLYWALEIQPTIEPVYVNRNGEEEFWIRGTSSSRKLSLRESIDYINSHFNNPSQNTNKKSDEI